MTFRSIAFAATAAAALTLPGIAHAYWGQATGSVNMRTCNSTACAKIMTVPAGAQVWVSGNAGNWFLVSYAGREGYVSANYVRTEFAFAPARPTVTFGFTARPAAPTFGFVATPYWDPRYNAWYDGSRWFYNNTWYATPPRAGFSIGFNFRG
jgi:uncharacterized protein YraI